MSASYLLILVSLLIALGFLVAYIWAVRSGQFDDTYTPALRVLLEESPPRRQVEPFPPGRPAAAESPATPASPPPTGAREPLPEQKKLVNRQSRGSRPDPFNR